MNRFGQVFCNPPCPIPNPSTSFFVGGFLLWLLTPQTHNAARRSMFADGAVFTHWALKSPSDDETIEPDKWFKPTFVYPSLLGDRTELGSFSSRHRPAALTVRPGLKLICESEPQRAARALEVSHGRFARS